MSLTQTKGEHFARAVLAEIPDDHPRGPTLRGLIYLGWARGGRFRRRDRRYAGRAVRVALRLARAMRLVASSPGTPIIWSATSHALTNPPCSSGGCYARETAPSAEARETSGPTWVLASGAEIHFENTSHDGTEHFDGAAGVDPFAGVEPFDVYTRAQGIADGMLIDVTAQAARGGVKYPTAITMGVQALCVDLTEMASFMGCTAEGRLTDVLMLFILAARRCKTSEFAFEVLAITESALPDRIKLRAIIGPGDDAAPVITILLADED